MPLELKLKDVDEWDSIANEFISVPGQTVVMEHSLLSIEKWESKWKKPLLKSLNPSDPGFVTGVELADYFMCMCITPNVNKTLFLYLDKETLDKIITYINDDHTATTIYDIRNGNNKGPQKNEVITSELIYYWMIANGIPFECRKWHVNRLLTLINVCAIKENHNSKLSSKDTTSLYRELNEKRRKALGTRG